MKFITLVALLFIMLMCNQFIGFEVTVVSLLTLIMYGLVTVEEDEDDYYE